MEVVNPLVVLFELKVRVDVTGLLEPAAANLEIGLQRRHCRMRREIIHRLKNFLSDPG